MMNSTSNQTIEPEGADTQTQPAAGEFRFCLLRHVGRGDPPGKVFSLNANGTVKKTPVGRREKFEVADISLSLADLHSTLKTLGPEYHLTSGTSGHYPHPDVGVGAIAVTEDTLKASGDAPKDQKTGLPLIGFGDGHLKHRPGPGVLVIDTDGVQETPVSVQLRTAVPGIEDYARVERPSSSSFIYDAQGKLLSGLLGLHTYYGVADATDIPRALTALHKRLVLSGFANFRVSEAGVILEYSAVDRQMRVPSQPVYAGAARLVDGLVSKRAENTKLFPGRPLLDTRKVIRDLSPAEEAEYAIKVQQARAPLLEEAAAKRAAHREKLAQNAVRNSGGKLTLDEALASVDRSLNGGFLTPEHEIQMAGGKVVTVAEILANPTEFHRKHARDPHEPLYGSDTVAMIYTRNGDPRIVSFAHGKHTLMLGERNARDDFSTPEAEAALNDPATQKIIADAVAAAEVAAAKQKLVTTGFDNSLLFGRMFETAEWLLSKDAVTRIPPRSWEVPYLLLRNSAVLFGGPGGAGKSSLTNALAASIASGMGYLGYQPRNPTGEAVLILNKDDDTMELRRRFAALFLKYGVPAAGLSNLISCGKDKLGDTLLCRLDRDGELIFNEGFFAWLADEIRRTKAKVVFLDPFFSLVGFPENDNNSMGRCGGRLNRFAVENGVCVAIIAHTSKAGGEASNAGERNASAIAGGARLVDAVRLAHLVMPLADVDAGDVGLTKGDPRLKKMFGLWPVKSNYSFRGAAGAYFETQGVSLNNAAGLDPGDEVAVAVRFVPVTASSSTTVLKAILRVIADGVGAQTPYSLSRKGGTGRFLAKAVIEGVDWTAEHKDGPPTEKSVSAIIERDVIGRGFAAEGKVKVKRADGRGTNTRNGVELTAAGVQKLASLEAGEDDNPMD